MLPQNFETISKILDQKLSTAHKVDTFLFYFLTRLVIINLDVAPVDVPMVFEVINDRGVRLRPYEILKGKLLGQIDKAEIDEYNTLWDENIRELEKVDKADTFFRDLFRAKLAATRSEAHLFEGEYHRVIFEKDYDTKLGLKHNPLQVKAFLKGDFQYFTKLYRRLLELGARETPEFPHVFYNTRLTEMDSQLVLILSACSPNDPEEEAKIRLVSYAVDRLFVLSQLNKVYDSNRFADNVFLISEQIRHKDVAEIPSIIDAKLLEEIRQRKKVETAVPLEYSSFKQVGYQDYQTRFLRYFLARVELFLCTGLNRKISKPLPDLVTNTGKKNGYHVEHILSRNEQNLEWFDKNEELFEKERNRIGGLLLLPGPDNQSSGNEEYVNKLRTYVSTLAWNESLHPDFYKSANAVAEFIQNTGLLLEPFAEKFGPEELEKRSGVIYEIAKTLWYAPAPTRNHTIVPA